MKIHIVKRGETIAKIAKKYNLSVQQMKEANAHIKEGETLTPGMKVKVPTAGIALKSKQAVPISTKKGMAPSAPMVEALQNEMMQKANKPLTSHEMPQMPPAPNPNMVQPYQMPMPPQFPMPPQMMPYMYSPCSPCGEKQPYATAPAYMPPVAYENPGVSPYAANPHMGAMTMPYGPMMPNPHMGAMTMPYGPMMPNPQLASPAQDQGDAGTDEMSSCYPGMVSPYQKSPYTMPPHMAPPMPPHMGPAPYMEQPYMTPPMYTSMYEPMYPMPPRGWNDEDSCLTHPISSFDESKRKED